jgi:N6-L-threonylcarbamoyladenine synthase
MIILGIESSCDDTSISLLEANEDGFVVLAEKTASQIEIHKKYGGVVPEVAARAHAEYIIPLIEEVMAGQSKPDCIAVTSGPGLLTALLVGQEAARTLGYLWNVPIVAVNHIEGHIHSVELKKEKIQFPALCLIVSGGHSELIVMKDHGEYEKIGKTVDDAAGECFDKAAKLLGFDYPGGPKISKFALEGNSQAIQFPRPMLKDKTYNFSFSGLKTSVLYYLQQNELSAVQINPITLPAGIFGIAPQTPTISDFCASFEQAIIDVLVTKTLRAAEEYKPKTIVLGGGVSANKKLRETLIQTFSNTGITFLYPELQYAMDNATMIAIAGYYKALKNEFTDWKDLKADPQWELGE